MGSEMCIRDSYSTNEKQTYARRMCVLFIIGVVLFLVYIIMDSLGMADGGGISERIADCALGFPLGVMIGGILYTSGCLVKWKNFKKRISNK